MTEVEKLIIQKLDGLEIDVKATREEAIKAREEAGKAREEAGKAREEAIKAREEAGRARETAEKALTIAKKTQLLLENEISTKIDIIGEGHDFLKMRLDQALLMEMRREKMELELVNLRIDVNKLKERMNIA